MLCIGLHDSTVGQVLPPEQLLLQVLGYELHYSQLVGDNSFMAAIEVNDIVIDPNTKLLASFSRLLICQVPVFRSNGLGANWSLSSIASV